jgi:hypothetical protein
MKVLVALLLAMSAVAASNDELERKVDILADEIAALKSSQLNVGTGQTAYGLGQSASKVYFNPQGLSIGGYGEIVYNLKSVENEDGDAVNREPETEALRNVVYLGYKYNDNWVFNTEIEIEHVNEVFTEFMYVDYLHSDSFNLRFGLALIPMGLVNELHEPIYFSSVNRPDVEKYLIPSTWRENGVGAFGSVGKFSYNAFLFNGPDGDDIAAKPSDGIRAGRKKGGANGEKNASTGVVVLNGEYNFDTQSMLGGSVLKGAGSSASSENLEMTIAEVHGTFKQKGLGVKFLYAQVFFDNSDDWNDVNTNNVAETLDGYYVTIEYDIEGTKGSVYTPFVRFSEYDLRSEFDSNDLSSDSKLDRINTVVGLAFKPIDRLVFKADYTYKHRASQTGINELNLGLGFVY